MARLVTWAIIALAALNVGFLAGLPMLAGSSANRLDFPRPASLPSKAQPPEEREEPLVPVSELEESLRLPRIDTTPADEHSLASLAAYEEGDYEKAFEEAVLALDPTPLEDNELFRALAITDDTIRKSNGREANGAVDRALQPILREQDPQEAAGRLNNAAAMRVLAFYGTDPSTSPSNYEEGGELAYGIANGAEELAYQAADLDPSYCPALLNLTLFNAMQRYEAPTYPDLELASREETWTDYYPADECDDPALLYYLAQDSILEGIFQDDITPTMKLADRLQATPRWAGLAHSLRGDVYYWSGLYSLERTSDERPFTARRYFKLALDEYTAALALQPDDPAIHHGKALAYLELEEENDAVREAKTALNSAPDSPLLQRTLITAYEANGDYAAAARSGRELLSAQRPAPAPLSLVPYSPVSHGADRYSQLRMVVGQIAYGASAFFDDEVIKPFEPSSYYSDAANWYAPRGLEQHREEFQRYSLLRNDFLSGDFTAFDNDLERLPEKAWSNEDTLLLVGMEKFLEKPEGPLSSEAQATIDDYLAPREGSFYDPIHFYAQPEFRGNDHFYLQAGNFLREYEQYENALRIYGAWRAELERDEAGGWRLAEAEIAMGETLFLDGRNNEALATFERALKLRPNWPPYMVRRAFMHEKLGEYEVAEELYRRALDAMRQPNEWTEGYDEPALLYTPDNYQAAKHLGDMLLKQADMNADDRDAEEAQTLYGEAARAYREALRFGRESSNSTAAVNNLSAALLMKGEHAESVELSSKLTRPTIDESAEGWEDSIVPDANNPMFHLNLGYAYESGGKEEEAADHYRAAVESDPTFYPALNDLGVLAAKEGDMGEAKSYFDASLSIKPDYAHASYNMGVALLRSGDFLAAQHYLANAVRHDPSLSAASYDYVSDNELYFLDLSLVDSVPPDWEFAKDAENGMGMTSLLVVALLLGRIAFRYFGGGIRDALIEKSFSEAGRFGSTVRLPRLFARLRDGVVGFMSFGVPSSGSWRTTILAFFVSVPFIVVVIGWSLLWEDSQAKPSMLAALFYLAAVSLLVHHAGHALAALWFRMRVLAAPWPAGIVQALALVIIGGPAVAPMPANMIEGAKGKDRERAVIFLAGPAANILFASMLFALFLASHIPLLRLGAILNLTAAAVSLLLLPPLDGAMVGKGRHARLIFWVGMALAVASMTVYFSNELYCQQSPGELCWGIGL